MVTSLSLKVRSVASALPSEESLKRFDIETSDAVLKGGVDG